MTTHISPPATSITRDPAGRYRERAPGTYRPETSDRTPRWVRPALWAILATAAILYGWRIWSLSGNSYYSAAVLSGAHSWKAMFFGSLDAGNYITVDKPPLALWIPALVARVIGVNGWSLVGPQVVMGVAAVAVLYATVRRSLGYRAALIAALVMTLTPITVAINRDNNPDTLLVLLLVLGAWALQRALESGRLRWLLACAAFVGLGFNTKMMQAYLVLPGFALVYLLCAKGSTVRRIGHLAAAGVALAVSSAWWMLIVDQWPANDRPYIGGSTDNTVWDLVIGYNGLGRIFGQSGGGGGGQGANFGGTSGAGRLFNQIMAGQISWLIPFAVIALVVAVALRGRAPRTDAARAGLLLWGGWLAVHYAVFSFAQGTFHPYYTTAMAPALAALVGAGTVAMYQAPRRWSWALPLAFAVTGGWAFAVLRRTPSWHPWVAWLVAAATVAGVAGLLIARLAPRTRTRLALGAAAVGLAGSLAGPAAYATTTAFGGTGNGTNPTAGPATSGGMGGGPRMGGGSMPTGMKPPTGNAPQGGAPSSGSAPGGAPSGGAPSGGSASRGSASRGGPGGDVSASLVSYLEKNQGGATWLVAVSSAQSASSIILQTGKPVIAMGGFTGSDPAMTVAKLKQYVTEGKLRYVLLGGDNRGGGNTAVTSWIKQNFTVVKATAYGGSTSSSTGSGMALYRYNG
ncbi:glycosyltransferase family 39 protein [Actinoallomurus purpureus]|uniref:glycosyltransferase family 39 protein n=1 Tax=Actinoallomurus purpureus TaxID=478114 RepID=UPI00209322F5|nr:glycosyltransferase family 39 protein [Actinoallomurus purpureus]MCO6008221.1 glycosyltransferase family 39 protein [Actinoallomurus purpureus]